MKKIKIVSDPSPELWDKLGDLVDSELVVCGDDPVKVAFAALALHRDPITVKWIAVSRNGDDTATVVHSHVDSKNEGDVLNLDDTPFVEV